MQYSDEMLANICMQIFLSRCCRYFCNGFKCFKVFFRCFRCMFQVFHLPSHVCFVTVTSEYFKSRSGVASPSSPSAASPRCLRSSTSRRRLGIRRLLPLFSMPVTFRMAREMTVGAGIRALAGPILMHYLFRTTCLHCQI